MMTGRELASLEMTNMKIIYAPNPLRTIIELDDHEKKEFWYKLKIEEMLCQMLDAPFCMNENDKYFDLKRAREELNIDSLYKQEGETQSKIDQRIDEMCEYYIKALMDIHRGDCTCIACSCDKCYAPEIRGINTITELRKHEASKIGSAFWQGKDLPERSLSEAIEILSKPVEYPKTSIRNGYTDEQFQYHIPRWNQEQANACEWLKNYRDTFYFQRLPTNNRENK